MTLTIRMLKLAICYLIVSMSSKAFALDIPLSISGEIFSSSCSVNNDKVIEIFFDNISVVDVANNKNIRKITIPVNCEYSQGTPYVKVMGQKLNANENVLASDIPNFGIALYQGDGTSTKLILGSGTSNGGTSIGYPITNGLTGKDSGSFVITALPYKEGVDPLNAGSFTASASISISYN